MIIVADSSPLIFLGKLNCLELIQALFGEEILVPYEVVNEVLAPPVPACEEIVLREFFEKQCRIEHVKCPQYFVSAMSSADSAVLTLAIRHKADFMLVDDRIVREVALLEGIRPMGTLGIILRAVFEKHISLKEAQDYFDALIRQHRFRISINVYDALQKELNAVKEKQ